jgi:hypothetical protein
MTHPKVMDLASYCANLVSLLRELPEANDLRIELARAVEELRSEIRSADKRRAA